MHADASHRQALDQDAGKEPARQDLSWMYRSEAFAEDLDESPRVSVVAGPPGRRAEAPLRTMLRRLGRPVVPRLAG